MTSPAPVRLRLTRGMRVRDSRTFAALKAGGRRLACGCLIANWRTLPAGALPRLGVITPRKLGEAVVRSRARRLLRETFRLHQHDFAQPVELVLVARASINGMKIDAVQADFRQFLSRARLLKAKA